MKKILIVLYSIFLSFTASSYEFNNKKEYEIEKRNISNVPKVMHFFSFFCPYCYELEKIYNIQSLIKNKIDKKIKIQTYHVNFLGGEFSKILTKIWIIAQKMKVEEKIMMPIFKEIQENNTISHTSNIKNIFLQKTGINKDQYNKFWNSFTIKMLIKKNDNDINKIKLNHVPTMIVNGKYVIDYYKLEKIFKTNFSKKYIKLIKFLLSKK
ncbi:DsbA family protein [Buchnera aphidicola]|uniref:Thiol:disulfide interchange protein DsbA n=1 Tax=Buchnera aphidicola subsp. Schizaphis graminum (strain Sg) TaxID=198804 RepID=DSBA_BUCAP|nr:DsbA family protein [Buchnera aphidicola]Q8K9D1.1 RecName: Full=Thiol:disulfide interchange protein DsbA; Flags: Precursor [Buchnera aphidicola str. Sg (Schizaphis graminum)]AAM67960.1 thiol:disulfide interchange protein DsbA precursor [Buchnera aphidicola str. Sg (Schizaphis graminum)]AWI49547.1 thiol:disulfide interchange protein DsbA [Buchnera aphidicola (Schizaphis graminum)]